MGYRFLDPNPQFCDTNGDPLASGTVTFYTPGTLVLKNVYTTSALSVATDNPMSLNTAGRAASELFLSGDYRVILKDSTGATVWDRDPVSQLMTAGELQSNSFINCVVGGTADVITLTPTPAITAYADGQVFEFVATGTNTTNVTANVSGLGAKALTKDGSTALVAGDIVSGQAVRVRYDGTRLQLTSPNAHALKSAALTTSTGITQGLHTIPILAGSMISRVTNGAADGVTELATNDVMLRSKDFDQTTSEGVQFDIPMPKSWNEGTVTAQFGWTAASGAGTVTWTIAGVAFSDDDAMDAAFGAAQSVTDTLLTANDCHITSVTSAITIAGTPAESDFVKFQIARDIADTLSADAKLLWCKVFVTINSANDA